METVNYQDSIVEVFDKRLRPGVEKLLPDEFTHEQKNERIEAMRDFITTLTYDYNEKDEVTYDGAKHIFKVPSSLKTNPGSDNFDLQHDLVQLTLTSICPVRDHEMTPYMTLYADTLATVLVGNTTLEKNEHKYDHFNMLGMEGIDLLTNIFYTGNEAKINEFKNALAMNSENVEMESEKTRS